MSRFTLATLALFLAATAALAETVSEPWLGAEIRYDPAVWRIRAPKGGADLLLTCVAPECEGGPTLYAYAWRTGSDEEEACISPGKAGMDPKPVSIPATPLGFDVVESWSGCRALDTPIVEACAARSGTVWRIVSRLVRNGCNRDAPLPGQRLIELLRGIVPMPVRP
jgi:hypothetical protein